MNNIATIVVTYNRKELLRECIEALITSDTPTDVYIIDNNSTDGTKEYIEDMLSDSVFYKHLKKNVGGAGGFSAGINYAVKKGYKYIWIMDDDTIVKPDTLSKLLNAARLIGNSNNNCDNQANPDNQDSQDNSRNNNDSNNDNNSNTFGFLSSSVAWTDGSDCKMNTQTYVTELTKEQERYKKQGLYPVKAATFVSLLFNAEAIKRVGLPKREYFIWGDDKEYTLRLSKQYNCYNVADSKVVHKMATNEGSNITKDNIERINRYYYAYRNDFATARDEGVTALLIYAAGFILNAIRVILFAKDNKSKRLKVMLRGLSAGITFTPKIRYVKA